MLPNFLVIGAQRSGTSWIAQNLRSHPQVFLPTVKEIHFFDRHYDQGLPWYEAHFDDRGSEKAVGEATPAYLHGAYSPRDIPQLISQHLPGVKLIACLREPVERAYSNYLHNVAISAKNVGLTFEEKLAKNPEIVEIGFYAEQLERYYRHFPRERILVTLYDDLEADPMAFLRRIYDFLEIDTAYRSGIEEHKRNAAAGKGNLSRSKWLWRTERLFAKAGLISISERIRRVNAVTCPPMKAETRQELAEIYRPKNQVLATLIGRDLGHWSEKALKG